MSFQAVFMLEVYAYLVVAVTLKTRSLRFAPLTWSSHAGYIIFSGSTSTANRTL